MNEVQASFLKRIGLSQIESVTFDRLPEILEKTAYTLPFENSSVLAGITREITKENVTDKVLNRKEGGVCYELNTALYLFLAESGMDVRLVRGVTHVNGWSPTGQTHVAIILRYEGQDYLVDTGFGGNLPLRPVPFSGETVSSTNGEFRVTQKETEHGNYLFELKLNHKDSDWRIGYAFDTKNPVQDLSDLNDIQEIIKTHPKSPFNKKPLYTRLTETGSITLTENSLTLWEDGAVRKEELDESRFRKLKEELFG